MIILAKFDLSSANGFNLVTSKVLLFGKGVIDLVAGSVFWQSVGQAWLSGTVKDMVNPFPNNKF